ncbi:hypothetical protein BOTBODRAFT_59810 [Botryobasidium botryosum FD-172 SS1]|uniref:Ras GEF n=1 Tax=Botryobasidium botryosum (strain FD-172 SS1) TaxID=930990 RepID=A0A067LZ69_BOTB1|nr:hypothetical protein BOTBODRAFT_59810 [Botryobasidium botryosum FD-172 SS1]
MRYATLEEILNKLFFLAVTDEDPQFIEYFLLDYRRFATPRSVLLGMQKFMISLSKEGAYRHMAMYAQLRLSAFLERWIETYPHDFASPGAPGALSALLRQMLGNTHLVHYATDLLPFLDTLPDLVDHDEWWAKKDDGRVRSSWSDDGTGLDSEDMAVEIHPRMTEADVIPSVHVAVTTTTTTVERTDVVGSGAGALAGKGVISTVVTGNISPSTLSMPTLTTRGSRYSIVGHTHGHSLGDAGSAGASHALSPSRNLSSPAVHTVDASGGSPRLRDREEERPPRQRVLTGPDAHPDAKANIKELLRVSQALMKKEPMHIAEEITRVELTYLLAIQPRDWLRHIPGKKAFRDEKDDPISEIGKIFNYIANWTASLILANESASKRLKMMEKFCLVARSLRVLNNYSGMRAVVTGVNMSRLDGDYFSQALAKKPFWKSFQSLEILLSSMRMYNAYRIALRNTAGPAIPDLEVHTSDIYRSEDSNPDFKPSEPHLIHWGKFMIMGRIICTVTACQTRCRNSPAYKFEERRDIYDLLMGVVVMDYDTIRERSTPPSSSRDIHSTYPFIPGETPSTLRIRKILSGLSR